MAASGSTPNPFAELAEALRKKATIVDKVRVEGRKLFTASPIQKDEVILRIPFSCCLTSELGKQSEMGKLVLDKKLTLNEEFRDQVFLTLFYLEDKEKKASFFAPYYKVFPTNKDDYPLFWPKCCRTWLRGSSMSVLIEAITECIQEEYKLLCRALPSFAKHTYEDYAWARMLVSSRAFRLTVKGKEVRVFAPLADMMDHAERRRTDWGYDEESNSLTVKALEFLPKDTEVQCHYGKKSAKNFVLYYGFAPLESLSGAYPHLNEVQFVMFLHSEFPCTPEKEKLVNEAYTCRKYGITTSMHSVNTRETLSFMRFLVARGGYELKRLPKMGPGYNLKDNPIQPLSLRNEIEMLEMLYNMMGDQLESYTMSQGSKRARQFKSKGADEDEEEEDEEEEVEYEEEAEEPESSEDSSGVDSSSNKIAFASNERLGKGVKRKREIWGSNAKPRNSSSERELSATTESLESIPSFRTTCVRRAWKMCDIIIRGEKMVCRHYLSLIEEIIPVLKRMKEAEESLQNCHKSETDTSHMLDEMLLSAIDSLTEPAKEYFERIQYWITQRKGEM